MSRRSGWQNGAMSRLPGAAPWFSTTPKTLTRFWELTLEKFLHGFKLWVQSGGDQYGAVQGEAGGAIVVDCCNIDAGCADEIIQYALFKEVVYG